MQNSLYSCDTVIITNSLVQCYTLVANDISCYTMDKFITKEALFMKPIILNKLHQIEQEENVTILHAVESGSRAWGFPSPDSDYDVRFIYYRPLSFYLSLEKTRDVIEWQLDETLDINGWDLQKALRLLRSSNPTLFEWCQSPIVYQTTSQFEQFKQVMADYFVEKSGIRHYLSTAYNNYTTNIVKHEQIKLKKYFYVLRPILACYWILAKKTPPPMTFQLLVDECLPQSLQATVTTLLTQKMQTSETGCQPHIGSLDCYIEEQLSFLKAVASQLPPPPQKGWTELNQLFCRLIGFEG